MTSRREPRRHAFSDFGAREAHAALAALSKAWAMGPKRCGPNLLLSFADAVFPPADMATGVAHTYPLAPPTAALALGLADPGAAAGSEALAPIALEHLHVLGLVPPFNGGLHGF